MKFIALAIKRPLFSITISDGGIGPANNDQKKSARPEEVALKDECAALLF